MGPGGTWGLTDFGLRIDTLGFKGLGFKVWGLRFFERLFPSALVKGLGIRTSERPVGQSTAHDPFRTDRV